MNNLKKVIPFRFAIGIIVLVIVLIATILLAIRYQVFTPKGASVATPATIQRGSSVDVDWTFRKEWPNRCLYPVRIIGSDGNNYLRSTQEANTVLKEMHTYNTRVERQNFLNQLSGFMLDEGHNGLVNGVENTYPGIIVEDIGCDLGLGPPTGSPPLQSTSRYRINVLQETPPGIYQMYFPRSNVRSIEVL